MQAKGKRAKELGGSYDLTRYYNAFSKPLRNGEEQEPVGTLLDSEAYDLASLFSGNIKRTAAREAIPLFCDAFEVSVHLGFQIPAGFDPAGGTLLFGVLTLDTEKAQTDDQYVLEEGFTDISGILAAPPASMDVGGRQAVRFTIRPGSRVVKFRVAGNGFAQPAGALIQMEVSGWTERTGYAVSMLLDELRAREGDLSRVGARTPLLGLRALP